MEILRTHLCTMHVLMRRWLIVTFGRRSRNIGYEDLIVIRKICRLQGILEEDKCFNSFVTDIE